MNDELVKRLRDISNSDSNIKSNYIGLTMIQAADAIEKLNKRIDFLMNCIYEAEDSLDRGADNDWARAALEKAERGQDDV